MLSLGARKGGMKGYFNGSRGIKQSTLAEDPDTVLILFRDALTNSPLRDPQDLNSRREKGSASDTAVPYQFVIASLAATRQSPEDMRKVRRLLRYALVPSGCAMTGDLGDCFAALLCPLGAK